MASNLAHIALKWLFDNQSLRMTNFGASREGYLLGKMNSRNIGGKAATRCVESPFKTSASPSISTSISSSARNNRPLEVASPTSRPEAKASLTAFASSPLAQSQKILTRIDISSSCARRSSAVDALSSSCSSSRSRHTWDSNALACAAIAARFAAHARLGLCVIMATPTTHAEAHTTHAPR